MIFKFKHSIKYLYLFFFIFFTNCQLQEPNNNHGILFLENRSSQLIINKNNKNDVIRLLGNAHTVSIDKKDWIYIERVLTKGRYYKLGQNVLKTNNVLVLTFDKYGILKEKNFLDKNDLNKMTFSKQITENNIKKKSFVQKFLSSIKSKMYGNK